MTGNLADAQDLVQEAYARAWQRWSSVSTYDDPEAWVRTVAWRLAASKWRKTKNGVAAMLRHGPPEPRTRTEHRQRRSRHSAPPDPGGAAANDRAASPGRPVGRRGRPRDARPRGHREGPPVPRPCRPCPAAHRRLALRGGLPCLTSFPSRRSGGDRMRDTLTDLRVDADAVASRLRQPCDAVARRAPVTRQSRACAAVVVVVVVVSGGGACSAAARRTTRT